MRLVLRGIRRHFFSVLAVGFLLADRAGAQSQSFPHGTVRLIAENSWVEAAHNFTLGLHFSLEDDWHIYWINPGDSGEPPRVAWELPQGLTSGPIQWPTPEKLGSPTVVDYGYEGEVTLLIPMQAAANFSVQQPLTVKANLKLLVCKDICIPGKTQVTLTLPVKAQTPPLFHVEGSLFAKARARLPRAAPAGWRFTATEERNSFVLSAQIGKRVTQAYFYPLEESQITNASQQPITPEASGFRLVLGKSDQLAKPVTRLRGVLQLAGDRAYLVDSAVVPPSKSVVRKGAG